MLSLGSNYFHTDREEEQREFKQSKEDINDVFEVVELTHQIMDIEESSYQFSAEYDHEFDSMDKLNLYVVYDRFKAERTEIEAILEDDEDEGLNYSRDDWKMINNIRGDYLDKDEKTDIDDVEIKASVGYAIQHLNNHNIKFGFQPKSKKRETTFSEDGDAVANETYEIDEKRFDFYLEDTWKISDNSSLQFGGRLEYTKVDQKALDGSQENDYTYLNPSLHYKQGITGQDQIRFSVAQTLRRPNFNEMVPFSVEDVPEDGDILIGNPDLSPESSIGIDLGYEHAFASQFGIIGANVFYRKVADKIEVSRKGESTTEEGEGSFYTTDNVGDGEVYGIEFDAGFPLTFIGIPSVSFFANYTYLESKIEDPYTKKERRFNDQPKYVYNFGLNQTLKSLGLSYGFSYQKQGDGTFEDYDVTEVTEYDANLEAYVEYKFDKELVLRFTGNNLLDAEVTEYMTNYDSIEDKQNGIVKSDEKQVERTGPMFMLTLSGRF